MDLTVEEFKEAFPGFNTGITDEQIQEAILYCQYTVGLPSAEQIAKILFRYAVAHVASISNETLSGEIASISAGGFDKASTKFKTQAESELDVFWTRTDYGQKYLNLRKSISELRFATLSECQTR